ncbi:hypothetical protein GCM10007103_22260 [Salinimicrobium marinum]|uniref:Uncharacterized protein n=1 Tax=Salinimicrobium marinum TaxID=680283 RepID=A0A918SI22_9FLAO|nr:hypothetical protein [Salinimicrobium marinum]GHA40335.1 hypothetical protein GCM10007103_22260 [Salinimicrobium marinum]
MKILEILNQRILIISVLVCFPLIIQAQEDKKLYTSTNILEIYINTEESLIHDENQINTGWGFELNSLHGIFIFKKFVLSAGIGVNFNIDEEYKSLPAILEIRYSLYDYGVNSPFVLLNTGKNIKIGSFLPGQTAKLGLGYNFESDYNFQYTIEFFKISKTYYTSEVQDVDYNYPADGYGISVGITF